MSNLKLDTFNDILVSYVELDRDFNKRAGTLSSALLALAVNCTDAEDFLAQCKGAETWIKSGDAGTHRIPDEGKLPRAFVQARSDIAAGLRLGLNPVDFTTLSAFKTAKVNRNKASEAASNVSRKDKGDSRPSQSAERSDNDTSPEKAVPISPLSQVLSAKEQIALTKYLAVLPDLSRSRAVKEILRLAKAAHDTHINGVKEGERRAQRAAIEA